MMITVKHYPNCRSDYPEKVKHELPQQLIRLELDDNEVVIQCVDCGAFVIITEKKDVSRNHS